MAFLKGSPLLYIHFSPIQTPRHHPCPTAHSHEFMVSFRGGELPVSTQTEMPIQSRYFVKMLPPQTLTTLCLGPSPGMLEISGSSLDEAKQGNEHFLPSLTIIIKLKKKMQLPPTLPM